MYPVFCFKYMYVCSNLLLCSLTCSIQFWFSISWFGSTVDFVFMKITDKRPSSRRWSMLLFTSPLSILRNCQILFSFESLPFFSCSKPYGQRAVVILSTDLYFFLSFFQSFLLFFFTQFWYNFIFRKFQRYNFYVRIYAIKSNFL